MQALGVQTAMKRIFPGAKIYFLNFPDFKRAKGLGARGRNDGLWNTFLQKGFAAYRLLKYRKLRKDNLSYTRPIDLFNYSSEDESVIKQYDLVVIGSDTILERAYNDSGRIGLNWMPLDVPKIYFAASASPANFEPTEELAEIASKAKYIGLRDQLTIEFFEAKLGIDPCRIVRQPDPSYFLDITKFKLSSRLASKLKQDYKYALYDFNSNFPLRKELADVIRDCGFKVVATAYNPYADICLDTIDACEWAGVFPLVDMVVTERFHDSVFGLRNCKPVIAIDWDPNRFSKNGDSKTLRILQDYGLEELHFNLCGNTELNSVEDAIKNIDKYFNVVEVEKLNNSIKVLLKQVINKIQALKF